MSDMKQKVAIVTGAAKNIGRATCIELAKLKFNIIIHANTDLQGAEETFTLVKKYGVEAQVIVGDLTEEQFVDTLISSS